MSEPRKTSVELWVFGDDDIYISTGQCSVCGRSFDQRGPKAEVTTAAGRWLVEPCNQAHHAQPQEPPQEGDRG